VQVLVPHKFRACGAQGFLKPAPAFRSSSYYKGGENQKNRRAEGKEEGRGRASSYLLSIGA
jgi:hypothetical protein